MNFKSVFSVVVASILSFVVDTHANASIIIADKVIAFFDSVAGPMQGPYGGSYPGTFPVSVPFSYATDGNSTTFVSLPTGSYITLGFSAGFVFDGPGLDLFVSEVGGNDETANIFISSDFGSTFTFLGKATTGTSTGFDLATIGYTGQVNAVKIVGLDSFGSSPGFDLAFVQGFEGSIGIPNYSLTVAKAGNGSGTVTSSPADINCGSTCSASYPSGTTATLTATPSDGSYFYGWSGACSGTGSCVVTMNAARAATAIFKPTPFVATTTSVITSTSATINTTITINPEDAAKTGSIFVTSWAPVSGLAALGISTSALDGKMHVTATHDNPFVTGRVKSRQVDMATLAATDPGAFVLIQLTSTGWQLVVDGQLIPYVSGVLGALDASISILNNTDPTNLLGAQFCVGYGTSAEEMIAAGRVIHAANVPDTGLTAVTNGSCNVAANPYKGLWYNASEPGWGMSVTQHDNINFVALYTYDQTGLPAWYVMSSCPITTTAGSCTGDIYKVVGGKSPVESWAALDFTQALSTAGSGTLTFSDANNGTFAFTIDGLTGTKTIERQQFSNGTAAQSTDYTDLWWNENENGWGVALTQDMGMLFATWYAYDASGNPVWYVASNCPLSGSGCTGDIYKVTGGAALTSAWNATVAATSVGTVTFAFEDSGSGTMSYTIDGVAGTKAIVRQPF